MRLALPLLGNVDLPLRREVVSRALCGRVSRVASHLTLMRVPVLFSARLLYAAIIHCDIASCEYFVFNIA